MNNPNYRIIIEPISEQGAGNLPEELRGGLNVRDSS